MWQVGRVCHRGSGSVLAVGPLGVALVAPVRAEAAQEVVEGLAQPADLTTPALAAEEALFLLDLSGPAPRVTLSGEVHTRAWAWGQEHPRSWDSPLDAGTVDPTQWVALDVSLGGGGHAEEGGMWLPLREGVCHAGVVRIGIPGLPPVVAPVRTDIDEGDAGDSRAESVATTPGPHPTPTPTPTPTPAPAPTPPTALPDGPDIPDADTVVPGSDPSPVPPDTTDPDATDPDTTDADTPDPDTATPPATPLPAAPPPTTPVPTTPVTTAPGIPSTWAAVLDARTAPPSPPDALEDTLTPWDPSRLGGSPHGPLTRNPEAFERTMTPALLEELRRAARAHGHASPDAADAGDTAPSRIAHDRGAPARGRTSGDAPPAAFLIHAGAAPVELTRDVVIGRDPDTRALTGRPPAATLRVPSPAGEISRSHCVVLATAPGTWSAMDLGSANGTVVRTPQAEPRQLPAMVASVLADGDLVDLGEGIVVEFRVRPR